jgi:UPF0755 protein
MTRFTWLVLLLLCCLAAVAFLGITLNSPYSAFNQETFVEFPRGTGIREMAAKLESAGVIHHWWAFLMARAIRRGAKLKAGEYRFTAHATVLDVYDRIARGDIFYYELVVPEGKNMFDIAAAVEKLDVFSAVRFLEAARDPTPIRDLDPDAPTLEGYLFPDTYRLSRGATPDGLCLMMTGRFRAVWHGLHTDASVHRTVTLASLVEKEGKLAAERSIIASVFARRLALGMRLDCDPTTIYAAVLDGSYGGTIHRSDLDSDNPYNTYRHAGLPPGPIANPGLASIMAALHPADTDYLYFVARADGSGGHNFSSDLAAQEVNIGKYRKAVASRP